MWKIKWKIYGRMSWAYCHKAERLINKKEKVDPKKYRRKLQSYVDKMFYYMDKRLALVCK